MKKQRLRVIEELAQHPVEPGSEAKKSILQPLRSLVLQEEQRRTKAVSSWNMRDVSWTIPILVTLLSSDGFESTVMMTVRQRDPGECR